jgi:hypothetical protein
LGDRLLDEPIRLDAKELARQCLQLPLTSYIHAHAGRPAVCCGGGPSLREQLERAPPDAVYLSANAHGFKVRNCDYAVAVDNDIGGVKAERVLRPLAPVISPRRWADVRMFTQPVVQSGILAGLVARALGCTPIVFAGMDLYADPRGTYLDDPKADSSGLRIPLEDHRNRWRTLLEKFPGPYRTLGGPLEELMPRFDPLEPVAPPIAAETLMRELCGTIVRFRKQHYIGPFLYAAGQIAELGKNEAHLLKTGRTVELLGRGHENTFRMACQPGRRRAAAAD